MSDAMSIVCFFVCLFFCLFARSHVLLFSFQGLQAFGSKAPAIFFKFLLSLHFKKGLGYKESNIGLTWELRSHNRILIHRTWLIRNYWLKLDGKFTIYCYPFLFFVLGGSVHGCHLSCLEMLLQDSQPHIYVTAPEIFRFSSVGTNCRVW